MLFRIGSRFRVISVTERKFATRKGKEIGMSKGGKEPVFKWDAGASNKSRRQGLVS